MYVYDESNLNVGRYKKTVASAGLCGCKIWIMKEVKKENSQIPGVTVQRHINPSKPVVTICTI